MATGEQDDRKRKRSPAYPSIGLRAALGHAKEIYKYERRSAVPVAVVAKHCNADIKSSKGLRIIAALKQFGLVVEIGSGDTRKVKVSDQLVELEVSDNETRKREIIKECALRPTIHKKIWGHYDGHLPSDATLKLHLIQELDFNDAYAGRFIKQFRGTLAFAGLKENDILERPDEDQGGEAEVGILDGQHRSPALGTLLRRGRSKSEQNTSTMRDLPITLPSLQVAVLRVPYPMSEEDYQTLENSLKAFRGALLSAPIAPPEPNEDEPDDSDDD